MHTGMCCRTRTRHQGWKRKWCCVSPDTHDDTHGTHDTGQKDTPIPRNNHSRPQRVSRRHVPDRKDNQAQQTNIPSRAARSVVSGKTCQQPQSSELWLFDEMRPTSALIVQAFWTSWPTRFRQTRAYKICTWFLQTLPRLPGKSEAQMCVWMAGGHHVLLGNHLPGNDDSRAAQTGQEIYVKPVIQRIKKP